MPAIEWSDAVAPYAGSTESLACPAAEHFGYAYNRALDAEDQRRIANPKSTPMVFDSKKLSNNAAGDLSDLPTPARHPEGNSVLYADGHAGNVDGSGKAVNAPK
jgi:prepilin-type processing-associated H-X9-DG protein